MLASCVPSVIWTFWESGLGAVWVGGSKQRLVQRISTGIFLIEECLTA